MDETVSWLEEQPKKKGLSTGAKWGIGCGCGCLTLILITICIAVFGWIFVQKFIAASETELKELGFEKVVAEQMIEINDPVSEPTLFKGMIVNVNTDCSTSIAVLAQSCEVRSKIDGKLYFRGQLLTIHPGAEISGGVDATAQVVCNKGKVEGGISGKHELVEGSLGAE